MTATTTNYGWTYPTNGDPIWEGAFRMGELAKAIDARSANHEFRIETLTGHLTGVENRLDDDEFQIQVLTGHMTGAGNRLDTLEGQNLNSRLTTAEGRITNLRAGGAAYIATAETTTSTSYTDLATVGPSVTVTLTESRLCAIVISAEMYQTGAANRVWMSYGTTGATVSSPSSSRALVHNGNGQPEAYSRVTYATLAAGTTTVKANYAVTGGTGQFSHRTVIVIPM